MTPQALQLLTWALGGLLTITLFVLNQVISDRRALVAENKALTTANIDLKLAVSELKGMTQALERTLNALPTATRHEGNSP